MCRLLDHYASGTKETIEMPTQESAYDIIPYATSDNYETIGEEDRDPSVVLHVPSRPRLGCLPTSGYSGLMPVPPSAPVTYSRMDSYLTSVDVLPDSTVTKTLVAVEAIPEKQFDELETGKTDSPPKEYLGLHVLNDPTYLDIRE